MDRGVPRRYAPDGSQESEPARTRLTAFIDAMIGFIGYLA